MAEPPPVSGSSPTGAASGPQSPRNKNLLTPGNLPSRAEIAPTGADAGKTGGHPTPMTALAFVAAMKGALVSDEARKKSREEMASSLFRDLKAGGRGENQLIQELSTLASDLNHEDFAALLRLFFSKARASNISIRNAVEKVTTSVGDPQKKNILDCLYKVHSKIRSCKELYSSKYKVSNPGEFDDNLNAFSACIIKDIEDVVKNSLLIRLADAKSIIEEMKSEILGKISDNDAFKTALKSKLDTFTLTLEPVFLQLGAAPKPSQPALPPLSPASKPLPPISPAGLQAVSGQIKRSGMKRVDPGYYDYAKPTRRATEKMARQLDEATKAELEEEQSQNKRFVLSFDGTDPARRTTEGKTGEEKILNARRAPDSFLRMGDNAGEICPKESARFQNCEVGVAATIGSASSRDMEDEHLAVELRLSIGGKEHTAQLCGVFDGHNGRDAAAMVKEHLADRIKQAFDAAKPPLNDEMIGNVLTKVFIEMGEEITALKKRSGTCANVAFIMEGFAYVANVGDSRAIKVAENGKVTQGSEDAKPYVPRFSKSVQERKGQVFGGQVATSLLGRRPGEIGTLAVTRDIGLNAEGIIARPKITKIPVEPGSYLCLACDGVWDVATSAQIGKAILDLRRSGRSLEDTAQEIALAAVGNGSSDNITCMVVHIHK